MIDRAYLDSIGDNWMVRTDQDGKGHDGFQWAPIGEWTHCPKWSDATTNDCKSGGLFGQGPRGYGYAQAGTRFLFCETAGGKFVVKGNKVKVQSARILYAGADAMAALCHVTKGTFHGSLDLSGCTLPDGLALPQTVGGSLDLSGAKMGNLNTDAEIKAAMIANRDAAK